MTKEAQVNLISSPENLKKIIYTACRTCYSADSPINIWDADIIDEKILKLVLKVMESGHHSTVEHAQFVFTIRSISRAATHQIVRHRHMSFSQKSQRYVTETGQFEYYVPESIEFYEPKNPTRAEDYYHDDTLLKEYNDFMHEAQAFYTKMIKKGIPAEDARYVLPNAATSSMQASLNLSALIHLCNLRLCTRAQKEIRMVVKQMRDLVLEQEPWLKPFLQPKCVKDGGCTEFECCGFNQPREKKEMRVM